MNRYLVLQCDTITLEYIADILMFEFCAGMSWKRISELKIVIDNWIIRFVVLLSEWIYLRTNKNLNMLINCGY